MYALLVLKKLYVWNFKYYKIASLEPSKIEINRRETNVYITIYTYNKIR